MTKKKPELPNLVFVHVPKCAGTSVITALSQVYKRRMWRPMGFRKTRKHVGWQWQSALPLTPGDPKTMPKSTKAIAGHFTWSKWANLRWPMFTFLRNPRDRVVSQYSIVGNRKNSTFKEFVASGPNSMSYMVGDLSSYFFVGLREYFEESMEMLEWYSGLKFQWPLKHRNHNRAPRFEPTKKNYRLIDRTNTEDIQLYKQALQIFERQREEYNAR